MSDTTAQGIQGLQVSTANWNGAPTSLNQYDNVDMPQTSNGSMIVTAINKSLQNNEGTITITSGGGSVTPPTLPAQATAPWVLVQNFGANNLRITNVSLATATPITVQAVGFGLPGITPKTLVIGTPLTLNFGEVAQGPTNPQTMLLRIQNSSSTQSVVGFIGGPLNPTGNNGYVVALNAQSSTPPEGYYAATTQNQYTYQFNWNGGAIFVANLSSANAAPITVTLLAI